MAVPVTCYSSLARTATPPAMADKPKQSGHRGLLVVIDTTAVPGAAPSTVFTVQGKDPTTGKYYSILVSPIITAIGTVVLRVYPGLVPSTLVSDGVLAKGTLAIDAAPEKFKTTTTLVYVINHVVYTKVATTAIVFSANHVVAAAKYGIVLVQIDTNGTISTKCPGATQTTPMSYASAAAALAALPTADSGNVALGYITLNNSASDGSGVGGLWTANTDDLTNTSDITAAAFVDATEQSLTPAGNTTVNDFLPNVWRVIATHGNANSHTYIVSATPIE